MLIAGLKTVACKCCRIKIGTKILKTVTKEAWHCATVELFNQKDPSPEEKEKGNRWLALRRGRLAINGRGFVQLGYLLLCPPPPGCKLRNVMQKPNEKIFS